MSKIDQLKKKNQRAFETTKNLVGHRDEIADELHRVSDVFCHAGDIISDLDNKFSQATKLNGKDITFLFFAAALQSARWILMPRMDFDFTQTPKDERLTSAQGGNIEKAEVRKYIDDHKGDGVVKSKRFYDWKEIITSPVPYDAMKGSERISINRYETKDAGKRLYGKNHHTATWGHDPVMGWIVGPLNITARMITFRDMQTYYVAALGAGDLMITKRSSVETMLAKSFASWQEDSKRLFAAVAKQGMHLQSDKYTKNGLQIPLINGDRAQQLLESGWNSAELEKILIKTGKNLGVIGAQVGISILINQIIKAIHLLCYDDYKDESLELYEVRTRKILTYSNLIASGSNVLYVALKKDIEKLDFGGIAVTLYRLITDYKFIQQIKKEFIEKEWYNIVMGDEFDFMKGEVL